jgi:hypothetical protein
MSEAELQKACIALLDRSGLVHWRIPLGQGGMVGRKTGSRGASSILGFPDLCGITASGLFWAVELKTDKGKLRDAQALWLAKLERSGALVRVVRNIGEMAALISYLTSEDFI